MVRDLDCTRADRCHARADAYQECDFKMEGGNAEVWTLSHGVGFLLTIESQDCMRVDESKLKRLRRFGAALRLECMVRGTVWILTERHRLRDPSLLTAGFTTTKRHWHRLPLLMIHNRPISPPVFSVNTKSESAPSDSAPRSTPDPHSRLLH